MDNANDQIVAKVNGRDVTRGDLSAAFDRVKNNEHWKNRIDATIDVTTDDELLMIREAIIFFTGSVPRFERLASLAQPGIIGFSVIGARVRVRAVGYFAAIGA
jgi:hypothetical protein